MVTKEILNFYKKTSIYTDLGLYEEFMIRNYLIII